MTSPLDRARQLVALASNPAATENEARNAAVLACRLIQQHNLLGATSAHARPAPPRSRPVTFVELDPDEFQRVIESMFGNHKPAWSPEEHRVANAGDYPTQRVLHGRGFCRVCGGPIPSNMLVTIDLVNGQETAFHTACYRARTHG